MYVGFGLLLAALSVPMILRKVKPNGLYGFRVPATLRDPTLWYEVNAYAGKYLLATSLLFVFAAILLYFIPGLGLDAYALLCLGVIMAGLAVTLVRSVRYLSTLKQ
jgi:uncharacterized membrane protein